VYRRHHESGPFDLVHVELSPDGGVVACNGPSCWQCAREILDVGFVDGVWLNEATYHRPLNCPQCVNQLGEQTWMRDKCPHEPARAEWRRYTADEFYRVTLANYGLKP
jgi:hypothetical protein